MHMKALVTGFHVPYRLSPDSKYPWSGENTGPIENTGPAASIYGSKRVLGMAAPLLRRTIARAGAPQRALPHVFSRALAHTGANARAFSGWQAGGARANAERFFHGGNGPRAGTRSNAGRFFHGGSGPHAGVEGGAGGSPIGPARWEACAQEDWDKLSADEQAAWSALGWCKDTWPHRNICNPRLPPPADTVAVYIDNIDHEYGDGEWVARRIGTPHTRAGQFWTEAPGAELPHVPKVQSGLDKIGLQQRADSGLGPLWPTAGSARSGLGIRPDTVVEFSHEELDEAFGRGVASTNVPWNCYVQVGDRRFAPFEPRGWENMPVKQRMQAEWSCSRARSLARSLSVSR